MPLGAGHYELVTSNWSLIAGVNYSLVTRSWCKEWLVVMPPSKVKGEVI